MVIAIATPIVETVPLRLYEGRSLRVGETRVTLDTVVAVYNMGKTAEEIVESFDTLELADVYAVISYYLRHTDEVDAYIAEGRAKAEELRLWVEEHQGAPGFREQLRDRLAQSRAAS